MHHPGMQSEAGRLLDALEMLLAKWDQTTETWRDGNAAAIEKEYIERIAEVVRGALPSIGHLSDVSQSSFRKVSDPDRQERF